jgi:peptide/nickel transport system substrate-binding protein
MRTIRYFILFALVLFSVSCRDQSVRKPDSFSITARISNDPGFLNPVKSSGVTESIINQYLFLPLANYHPETLELIPVLLQEVPEGKPIENGPLSGTVRFDCHIKPDAVWEDGTPVSGYDYLFTIKTIGYRALKVNPSLRSLFRELQAIDIDPEDSGRFSIYVNRDYFLARELALIAEVLPEHLYDPSFALRAVDYASLFDEQADENPSDSLRQFIDFFNHADCGRTLVSGSGPYALADWQTNQRVILEKKPAWWGEAYPENPYLQAFPKQIVFSVIPSDDSALTELRNGSLDLIYTVDGMNFSRLKTDEKLRDKLEFHNPAQLKYYYVGINNHSPFFNDKRTRWALAHLIDLDAFIQSYENGLGVRINGPIHPIRRYYNDTLPPIQADIEKARSLLLEAGWKDTNQNGIVDKRIDGKTVEFSPELLITGKTLFKNIALTLQENGRDAGMDIQILTKSSKVITPLITKRSFDLFPTGHSIGLFPEELYHSWHSDNDYPGGRNRFGFNNPDADRLIESIRSTKESVNLDDLYRQIQEVFYREQAVLFLYTPTNNIVVSNRFDPLITVKKHGFFLNAFRLKKDPQPAQ